MGKLLTAHLFLSADFDAITDPIMKAKMVALKGINKVMVQNNMGMTPIVINRFQPGPAAPCPESTPVPPQAVGQVTETLYQVSSLKSSFIHKAY
jgi:histone-lysine N-methyltransferase MLL3